MFRISLVVIEKDWDENPDKICRKLLQIIGEVSEISEDLNRNRKDEAGSEFADVIIRTIELAAGLGYDIDKEVQKKMDYNAHRPVKHGGKRFN